ncbi:hypothetical protein C5167_047133 [Papaver somniferum]|uniref:MADS-box domain-containing protein n=1 Tax=Papaver somniferum TaxID=3469 RepID=A0A4Y7LH99_PAPSO|nr:hypothetical protein C5167_047133 [Papaver somniferum]
MGKRRIEMKKIEDRQKRNVCFTKRRHGLFNKAADLCRLTGADISLLVISPGEKVAQRKQELLAAAEPIATSTTTSTCTVGEMEEDSFLLEDDLEKLLSDAYDDAPNWLPSIDDSGMLFEGLDYDESWLPLGIDTVLVLVGPAILLLLKPAKDAEKSFSCLSLLGSILPYKTQEDIPLLLTVRSAKRTTGTAVITFDNVTERVARHLGLDDPTKIKLTPHRCCSQQPIAPAIKYHGFDHLSEMLIHHNQKSDILYFEVLDIPPPLLEGLKTLNVSFHHAKKDTVIHRISLPSKSTILEEEKNLGTRDCLVYVYHFIEDASETQKCSVVKTLVPMSLPKPTIS